MAPHPFIPVATTASVEFIYSNAGEINENAIHVKKGSPFSLADLQALRGVCITWDSAHGCLLRHGNASLIRVRTKALDTNTSPSEDYTLPAPQAGTIGGSPLSLNAALCFKLVTGLAGRSNRGRWYAGNLGAVSFVDAGHTNVATIASYVSHLTALKTALAAAGYTWVVTSFMTGGAWRAAGVNNDIIGIVGVDTAIDSQRRRLPGRGH